jgi:MFS family permease
MRAAGGLAPLRHRGFRRLAAGSLASSLGDSFYAVALPWYVLERHGGVLLLGTVLAAYGIARAACIILGGHLSDRLAPWTVMMGADIVRTAVAGAFALVAALGPARGGLLIPIAVVIGAGEGVFLPASMSIVPSLLPDADLQAGNALASTLEQLPALALPLGGLLVALAGPVPAFAINAGSFALSALALEGVRRAPHPGAAESGTSSDAGPAPTLRRMLRGEPVVRIIFLVTIAANLGSGGMSEVALPALAHGPLHARATGYGLMLAAFGIGAVAGTLLAAQTGRPRHPALVASWAFLAEAGFEAAVPYLGSTAGAGLMLLGFGALNGFANILTLTAFQRWAPRALLGRLMSVIILGAYGIFPVSVLLGGIVVHGLGPAAFFPIAAVPLAVALLGALGCRSWREFGETADAGAEPARARA